MKTATIFIKSYSKDYKWLYYCLKSIDKFVTGYTDIVIVIPEGEHKILMRELGITYANQTDSGKWEQTFGGIKFYVKQVIEYGDPYLFQQAVKINAFKHTVCDYVVFVDSDCIFTREVNVQDLLDKPVVLYSDYSEVGDAQCWKEPTEKFMQQSVQYEFMRRHPFVYKTDDLKRIDLYCKDIFGQSVEEYVMSQQRFSEFNSIGAWCYKYSNGNYTFVEAKTYTDTPFIHQAWSHSGLTKKDLKVIYGILHPEIEFTEEDYAIVRGDTHIGQWIKTNKRLDFDLSATPLFLNHIKEGDIVVDCGANVGAYAWAFLQKIGSEGKLVCFEPGEKAFLALKYNLHGYDNVTLVQSAVGQSMGVASFMETENTGASHILNTESENESVVRVIDLDTALLGLPRVDFIKIDCEGTEEYVLRGASNTISKYKPNLVIEINEGAAKRYSSSGYIIMRILDEYGYVYQNIYSGESMEGEQYDISCVHPEKQLPEQSVKQPVINFKHMGNAGDIIYSLSGIKALCDKVGAKARILVWLNRPAHYYNGAYHPTRDFKGNQVTMNHYMLKMIKPLLEAQPYIEGVEEFVGQEVDVDLDQTHERDVNKPYGDVRRWYAYCFHGMHPDMTEKVIDVDVEVGGEPYILVNRTQRYYNPMGSYAFLRRAGMPIVFAGTPEEYELFQKEVPEARYLEVDDFLVLAAWIKGAKVFIGNQSMCFAIAEQMKTPRILEVCKFAPNVIPVGGKAWDWLSQSGFELAVKEAVNYPLAKDQWASQPIRTA